MQPRSTILQRVTLCLAVLSLSSSLATGALLTGRVTDEDTGQGLRRLTLRAYAHGRSLAHVTMTEDDGSFSLDLPAGGYALCIPAVNGYRAAVAPFVKVTQAGATRLNLALNRSLFIKGDSWLQAHKQFAQSFRATGLGITELRIKAFGPPGPVRVQILDGDSPSARPLGPARVTDRVGNEATASVRWSGNEVSTVPGQQVTVRMTGLDGKTWIPAVAGRGDVYAQGQAWFDQSPRPLSDLGIGVCEDNDQFRTNYSVDCAARWVRARSVGQTFKALSKNITFVSARFKGIGTSTFLRFSIHRGAPGGAQIGPSKAVAPGADAAVAWAPDEVPVEAGQTYHLHIESFNGAEFLVASPGNMYDRGVACFNGRVDQGRDIVATVGGSISQDDIVTLTKHPRHERVITLRNPSFEEGVNAWSRSASHGAPAGCEAGILPRWGQTMFGWTHEETGKDSRTQVLQAVRVTKGRTYAFSGWVYTDHRGGRSSDVRIRLIMLPDGEDDLLDTEALKSSQWYATEGYWCRGSLEFVARSDRVKVGFDMEQRFALDSSSLYIDGAFLEEIGTR